MFEELKNKVKTIIDEKKDKEIDEKTNNKNIGIYMIYIDNFDDDKIIPIYIGQTGCGKNRNFQNRYKEHLKEVMALNRLKYDYYKYVLLSNFYDGHYKTCKIFQYEDIIIEYQDGIAEKKLNLFVNNNENDKFLKNILEKFPDKNNKFYHDINSCIGDIHGVTELINDIFKLKVCKNISVD